VFPFQPAIVMHLHDMQQHGEVSTVSSVASQQWIASINKLKPTMSNFYLLFTAGLYLQQQY
jgi:hypothetical protein